MLTSRRLFFQTAISWVFVLVEIITGFLIAPILIKSLGADRYGVWVVFNSTHALANLLDLGLRGTLNRVVSMSSGKAESHALAGSILRILLVGAAVSTVGHLGVGAFFPEIFPKAPPMARTELVGALGVMSLSVYCSFVTSTYSAYLAASGRNHESTLIGTIVGLLRLPVVMAVVSQTQSLVPLAACLAGLSFLQVMLLRWRVLGTITLTALLRQPFKPALIKRERGHAAFSFASRSAFTFYAELPSYAAMLLLGSSSVALLSFCFMLVSFSRRLIEGFGANVYPLVMQACARHDNGMLRQLFHTYLLYTSVIASLFYFGIAFYGADFLRLWLAPTPFELDGPLRVLALGTLLAGLAGLSNIVLEGFGRYWRNLLLQAVEVLLNVTLVGVLIGVFDLAEMGIALAFVVPRIMTAGLLLALQSRAIGMRLAEVLALLGSNLIWWAVAASCVAIWHQTVAPSDWMMLVLSTCGAGASFLGIVALFHRKQLLAFRRNRTT